MKKTIVLGALCVSALLPAGASGQGVTEVLGAVAQGGGWIQIPIQAGQGTVTSTPIPSVGLNLAGCMQIWGGHSGTWSVDIADTYGNGALKAEGTEPGESIPWTYEPGAWAQLKVDVRWSEPRDTLLTVWVGVEGVADRDPCQPVYGDGGS